MERGIVDDHTTEYIPEDTDYAEAYLLDTRLNISWYGGLVGVSSCLYFKDSRGQSRCNASIDPPTCHNLLS